MEFGRISISLAVAGMTTGVLVAGMMIWLLLNEPVALAGAIDHGDLSLVAEAVGNALVRGLRFIAAYL